METPQAQYYDDTENDKRLVTSLSESVHHFLVSQLHLHFFKFFSFFKDKLRDALGNDDVIVLGGNSPAFRSIVISLTIFLGALIGAVLLYEMVVFFYQRVISKNRTEDIESGGGN